MLDKSGKEYGLANKNYTKTAKRRTKNWICKNARNETKIKACVVRNLFYVNFRSPNVRLTRNCCVIEIALNYMIDFTAEEVYVTGGKDVIVGEKLFLVFIGHFFAYD